MGRLKLTSSDEKTIIATVRGIGVASTIVGAAMIWGWGGALLSLGLWLYIAATREGREQ
jgi:hypothetical protein